MSDKPQQEAKRYELGVHCSQLCLGGRPILTETTDLDPFSEDVVMATDYDALLARHREAIRLLSEITEYQPLSDSDDGYISVWRKAEAFLAVHFEEDKP